MSSPTLALPLSKAFSAPTTNLSMILFTDDSFIVQFCIHRSIF